MAIGKGSLFSLKSQGRIGKNVKMRTLKGQTVAQSFRSPAAAASAQQIAARSFYSQGVAAWRAMAAPEISAWAAIRPQISTNKGFSNFMSYWLKGGADMLLYEVKGFDLGFKMPPRYAGVWAQGSLMPDNKNILGNSASNAVGDYFELDVLLPAGTFQVEFSSIKWLLAGIVDIYVDGVFLAQLDLYDPSGVIFCMECGAPLVFPKPALHCFRCEVVGQNPLSIGFMVLTDDVLFRKVA
jgi:hypothetical protein